MSAWSLSLPTKRISAISQWHIFLKSFTHKMAAKATWHRNYVTVILCIHASQCYDHSSPTDRIAPFANAVGDDERQCWLLSRSTRRSQLRRRQVRRRRWASWTARFSDSASVRRSSAPSASCSPPPRCWRRRRRRRPWVRPPAARWNGARRACWTPSGWPSGARSTARARWCTRWTSSARERTSCGARGPRSTATAARGHLLATWPAPRPTRSVRWLYALQHFVSPLLKYPCHCCVMQGPDFKTS